MPKINKKIKNYYCDFPQLIIKMNNNRNIY